MLATGPVIVKTLESNLNLLQGDGCIEGCPKISRGWWLYGKGCGRQCCGLIDGLIPHGVHISYVSKISVSGLNILQLDWQLTM